MGPVGRFFMCKQERDSPGQKPPIMDWNRETHFDPGKRKNEMGQRDFPILRHTHLLEKCTHPGQGLVTGYSHFQLYSAEQSEAEVLGSCNL